MSNFVPTSLIFVCATVVRLVQPSVHQLHSAASHLLFPAANILSCHAHGDAVMGLLLDRSAGCSGQSLPG